MVSDTIKKQEVVAKNPMMMKPADIQADDSLEAAVVRNLQAYFETLNGMRPHHELYPMVMQAAQLLGINRNTLHKKLQFYKLI